MHIVFKIVLYFRSQVKTMMKIQEILFWTSIICTIEANVFITPDPGLECPGRPCITINALANATVGISANEQIYFLAGSHLLNSETTLFLRNVNNISLLGLGTLNYVSVNEAVRNHELDGCAQDGEIFYYQASSIIKCASLSSIVIVNVTNFSVHNLTFMNCGAPFVDKSIINETVKAGVILTNIYNISVNGITVINSSSYGLFGANILGVSYIRNSAFIANNLETLGFRGGNAIFSYNNISGSPSVAYQNLQIASCLFAFSTDVSCQSNQSIEYCGGSGLTVVLRQGDYDINVIM